MAIAASTTLPIANEYFIQVRSTQSDSFVTVGLIPSQCLPNVGEVMWYQNFGYMSYNPGTRAFSFAVRVNGTTFTTNGYVISYR